MNFIVPMEMNAVGGQTRSDVFAAIVWISTSFRNLDVLDTSLAKTISDVFRRRLRHSDKIVVRLRVVLAIE